MYNTLLWPTSLYGLVEFKKKLLAYVLRVRQCVKSDLGLNRQSHNSRSQMGTIALYFYPVKDKE